MAEETLFTDAAVAIENKFVTDYTGSLPLVWENDDAASLDVTKGFILFAVDFIDSNFASINGPNPLTRTLAAVNFDILTPINEGPGDGFVEAGLVAKIFRGQEFSNMLFFAPTILSSQRAKRPQGEFFSTPLTCPFQLDVNVTIT